MKFNKNLNLYELPFLVPMCLGELFIFPITSCYFIYQLNNFEPFSYSWMLNMVIIFYLISIKNFVNTATFYEIFEKKK